MLMSRELNSAHLREAYEFVATLCVLDGVGASAMGIIDVLSGQNVIAIPLSARERAAPDTVNDELLSRAEKL